MQEMKKLIYFIIIAAVSFACKNATSDEQSQINAEPQEIVQTGALTSIEFSVEGMTCKGCENAIAGSVNKLMGIACVEASHTDANAIVTFDTTVVSMGEIDEAIATAGYVVLDHKEDNQQ